MSIEGLALSIVPTYILLVFLGLLFESGEDLIRYEGNKTDGVLGVVLAILLTFVLICLFDGSFKTIVILLLWAAYAYGIAEGMIENRREKRCSLATRPPKT